MEKQLYLDTHVLIWAFEGRTELFSERAKKEINTSDLLVSPIVNLELQYLFEIEKIFNKGLAHQLI